MEMQYYIGHMNALDLNFPLAFATMNQQQTHLSECRDGQGRSWLLQKTEADISRLSVIAPYLLSSIYTKKCYRASRLQNHLEDPKVICHFAQLPQHGDHAPS